MRLKTKVSASTFFLFIISLFFPFLADLQTPLMHGEIVKWIENSQAVWLLFGAIFTFFYMNTMRHEQKKFWLWVVVWWIVLLGRSISWGRNYLPDEPKFIFRAISILLIAMLLLPVIFSNALRNAIAIRFRTVQLPLWTTLFVVVTFLIADSVEHHRFIAPLFLHNMQYTDLIEELYETVFLLGLFEVSFEVMKDEKKRLSK
ncbi:hypothetical protein QF24_004702 [Salmonella enterica subsp. enterica]|nr:hypothetical protein [Salmonella enterica subsp. enterica serovar Bere]ECF7121640.1 hypothetical protein [Salmonella enterica subsp. enterica]EDV5215946.1 hypothetical protein [Salmonella enterica subsp. enterica]EED2867541.1 hypothetical protein [Salmonella enterica subsp. enterica]